MTFGEYIYSLLIGPLKKTGSDISILCQSLGSRYQEIKDMIFSIRRAWVIETAPKWALDLHGQDRLLPRLPDEPDETYRRRLQSARTIYALGGTDPGIIDAMARLGFTATIQNVRQIDPLRWAEMNIYLEGNIDEVLLAPTENAIIKAIKDTKASHSKVADLAIAYLVDAYVGYGAKGTIILLIIGTASSPPGFKICDGTYLCDGSVLADSSRAEGYVN
jgi:hypothetical protein